MLSRRLCATSRRATGTSSCGSDAKADWDPAQYERFRDERSQPFFDLLALVRPADAMRVVDLGCGTGELTREMHRRLGATETLGVDSSEAMLSKSRGLEERGQVGATHMGTAFDAWYPGYIDYAPNFKNVAAFWTETALYQYATPHEYKIDDFPPTMRDLRPRSLYASPWPPGTASNAAA